MLIAGFSLKKKWLSPLPFEEKRLITAFLPRKIVLEDGII